MKKKLLLILTVSMFFVMTLSSSAIAAWYTVSVNMAGGTSTGVRIQITDDKGAFSKRWFTIAGNKSDQILASVLTAVSLKKRLFVQLGSTAEFADLTGCYLINN